MIGMKPSFHAEQMGCMAHAAGETHCYPDSVHAYPFVFLELLSSVSAALIPSLWSILRIKVKEPLSKGKLGWKTEGGGWEAEEKGRMRGKKSQWQRHEIQAGWWRRTEDHLSRWEQSRWFPSFSPRIYFKERGALKSAVINHEGGQMRCIIQSFPGCRLPPNPLKALAGPGSVLKTNVFRHGCGLYHEKQSC